MAGFGRKKRILTADETALWAHVTTHVQPLAGRNMPLEPALSAPTDVSQEPRTAQIQKNAAPHIAQKNAIVQRNKSDIPPLAPLEKRLKQRLSRGAHPIDAVIDLHGLRQAGAHDALIRFLRDAQIQGAAVVLVVTGKGGAGSTDPGTGDERGVLRRMVPHWLRMPELRSCVIGFESAAQHHGGSGALYVRIRRRNRSESP